MSGGLIALALASITGLLAVWLYFGQASKNTADLHVQHAELRCGQARFDDQFDSTLTVRDVQAQADAGRVARLCGDAERARRDAAAQSARAAQDQGALRTNLKNALGGELKDGKGRQ